MYVQVKLLLARNHYMLLIDTPGAKERALESILWNREFLVSYQKWFTDFVSFGEAAARFKVAVSLPAIGNLPVLFDELF